MDIEMENKSDLWDYYQELVRSHGFDGITGLLAENTRLQSVIDAANSQEPVAYGIPNSAITGKSQPMMALHHERCGQYPELMVPLFTAPVPAMPMQDAQLPVHGNTIVGDVTVRIDGVGEFICKDDDLMPIPKQEPAGAVHYDYTLECLRLAQDARDYFANENTELKKLLSNKSPRITEQDAREILISGFICHGFVNAVDYVDSWLLREGSALLNKLNANAVAEVRQEPAEKILTDIKDQQKNAWLAVCKALDEVKPDWLAHGKKGIDCAVEAIRSLSQPAQAAAMPEYLSAIEVLRENIRNPYRGVEYCGIFDNDKTRAAIGTLLSAAPKPE